MPTVNLVTDFGAVPDGQIITTTVTISSTVNPTHLQVTGSPFASGDVGKLIVVQGAGPAGVTHDLFTTIASFTDANHVVLTDPCSTTLAGVSKIVEWGTDCTPPLVTFKNAFQGQTGVVLDIPGNIDTGRYCLGLSGAGGTTGGSQAPFSGIPQVTAQGANTPILSDMLGNGGIFFGTFGVGSTYALTQTVAAGSNQLVMVNSGDASLFTNNTWAIMTGYDPQGFGFPPNPQFLQWVFITNISGGTITIQDPLIDSYESTWPIWFVPIAGPAALFVVDPRWDCEITFDGLNIINSITVANTNGRTIKYSNCTFPVFSPNCSQTQTFTLDTCTTSVNWEIDKLNDTVNFINSNIHFFFCFSSSTNTINVTGCTVGGVGGTPKKATFTNCHIGVNDLQFGPGSYGIGNTAICIDCTFSSPVVLGGFVETDITGVGGYSMSGGVISRQVSAGTGEPPQWAIPGQYFFIGSANSFEDPPIKVLDIFENAGTLFIQTDQFGGFPAPVPPATKLHARTGPMTHLTFTGCTGEEIVEAWSNVTADKPQYSQWDLTYNGNIGSGSALIPVFGTPVFVRITVNSGYSAGALNLDGPFVLQKPFNVRAFWLPVIDLTVPGVRTITTSGVTGSAGTDSGLAFPNNGNVWLLDDQITPKMSGAIGAGSIRIEILTDQSAILAGATVDYFFLFPSEEVARADPVIGPYLNNPPAGTLVSLAIWAFDLRQIRLPPTGWWAVIRTAGTQDLSGSQYLQYIYVLEQNLLLQNNIIDGVNSLVALPEARASYAGEWNP